MANKMTNCKACGAEIAKSAEACPQCGAKIKKPFYKKKRFYFLIVILAIIIAIVAAVFSPHKSAAIGDELECGGAGVTVTSVDMGDYYIVNGDKNSKDYLMPISEDEYNKMSDSLTWGETYHIVKATDETYGVIVVTANVKNIGNDDLEFRPERFKVYYDGEYDFSDDDGGYYTTDKTWEEFGEVDVNSKGQAVIKPVRIKKLSDDVVTVRVAIFVPKEVVTSDKPLTLGIDEYRIDLR